MANVTTGTVWRIDTAGVITTDCILVASIRWVGASGAADTAVIKNTAGKTLWEAAAQSADHSEESIPHNECLPWNGINVTALGSGVLFIYLA